MPHVLQRGLLPLNRCSPAFFSRFAHSHAVCAQNPVSKIPAAFNSPDPLCVYHVIVDYAFHVYFSNLSVSHSLLAVKIVCVKDNQLIIAPLTTIADVDDNSFAAGMQ